MRGQPPRAASRPTPKNRPRCTLPQKSCIFPLLRSNILYGALQEFFPGVPDPVPLIANFQTCSSAVQKNEAALQPPSRFGEFNMAWYAYCLTEHQTLPNGTRSRRPFLLDGIQGVNGASVLGYPSGEFAVIVSDYERNGAKLDEKSVLEHARVVSVCFRSGTVLPFRFGTIFDTDDALRQAVRCNRRTFGQSVAKLRGKSE